MTTDPRGGLFIDSGDGRGPIHTDDMTDAERATHGLPAAPSVETSVETSAPAPTPEISDEIPTEDVTDGR